MLISAMLFQIAAASWVSLLKILKCDQHVRYYLSFVVCLATEGKEIVCLIRLQIFFQIVY